MYSNQQIKAVLCLVITITLISSASAWGSDGHQIVGQVANAYLTSATQSQLAHMLGSYTLANISTWPDNYDHTDTGAWSETLHFVNSPTNATEFSYSFCEPPYAVPYGCVIAAISNFTFQLENDLNNGSPQECYEDSDYTEPCPLSFLTHFLGDSHQPLHVAFQVDKGGNSFDVEYDNECTNVHSVWDSRLLYTYEDDMDDSWYEVSQTIVGWLNQEQEAIRVFSNTTKPADWGSETFAVARIAPYNLSPATVPAASQWYTSMFHYLNISKISDFSTGKTASSDCGPVLSYQYYQKSIPIVFVQLAKGGVRLAYLLNTIYDPNFTGF